MFTIAGNVIHNLCDTIQALAIPIFEIFKFKFSLTN